ncbi:MAG: glycosyltransferase family 4 protein [Tissierellia bacterium]|nr:glycosyltransferase family 4 protein [Tissierellia bacterium]
MKVLITTDLYIPTINGVVTSVVNLRKELTRLGHEVKVLTLSQNNDSYIEDNVVYIGSRNAQKIYPGARFTLTFDSEYIEELIRWKPDIIHTQCELSTFRMAKYIANILDIPIVHTYHTVYEDYTHYFSPNRKLGKKIVTLFTRRILKHVDLVIAPTEKVKSLLISYGVDKEIYIIPTGIDLNRFNEDVDYNEKKILREKIGIPSNSKVLINVSRLAREKNIEELLFFISKLEDDNLVLLIVGDGPHREELESYANKLGISNKVFFTGFVPPNEVHKYYKLGDVFVNASNSETQGLTYIEALASGLPVLCKEDPCLKGVVKNGINGWQYKNFDDFIRKLYSILDKEKYVTLKENAKQNAWQEFSSETFAKRVELVYERAIENHYNMIPYTLNS